MENTASSYGWFAAGAILGVAIAVLYAPKSGSDTRGLIGKKADKGQKALTETSKELIDKSKDLYERGRQIAEEAAELFERGRQLVRG
jgi:gas vesicle protein